MRRVTWSRFAFRGHGDLITHNGPQHPLFSAHAYQICKTTAKLVAGFYKILVHSILDQMKTKRFAVSLIATPKTTTKVILCIVWGLGLKIGSESGIDIVSFV